MSRETLQAAANHFFSTILPAATHKRLPELPNAEVLLGSYGLHGGGALSPFGQSLTPRFMLRVSPASVPIAEGLPTLGSAPVAAGATDQPLIWLRHVADALVDDEAAIADLMGDLDTYAQRSFEVAGVRVELTGETTPATSAAWAGAITASKAELDKPLSAFAEVPAGLRAAAPDTHALRLILSHFFTWDASGARYRKWKEGTGRTLPTDLSPEYLRENVRELQLEREQLYCYMLVPKALFATAAAEPHDYREVVLKLVPHEGTEPFAATVVHSVYRRVQTAAPFHDFVFFEAEEGLGLPIPAASRGKMSASLLELLNTVPTEAAALAAFAEHSPWMLGGPTPYVQILATVSGEVAAPAGVTSGGSGALRSILAPVEQVAALAALDAVRFLDVYGNAHDVQMDLTRPAVHYEDLRTRVAAGKRDGKGVIIGVIDSGIEGSHPSFLDPDDVTKNRILAVWQQDEGVVGNASSPSALHPGNAAYAAFNFGKEYSGAAVTGATDAHTGVSHGTHVASIASGAEVVRPSGTIPAGIAPKAKIVAVRSIGVANGNTSLAAQYIFQKADDEQAAARIREGNPNLIVPCVINMSFGHHDHAHDGTDAGARAIAQAVRQADGTFKSGRVLVAAAGNQRSNGQAGRAWHKRVTVGPLNSASYQFNTNTGGKTIAQHGSAARVDGTTFWARNTGAGAPSIWVWVRHDTTGWMSTLVYQGSASANVAVPGTNTLVSIQAPKKDIHNEDWEVRVFFQDTAGLALASQNWTINILNLGPEVEIHGWSARTNGTFRNVVAADDAYMTGTPSTSRDVVAVASTNSRISWNDLDGKPRDFGETRLGDISSFSSPGPLRVATSRLFDIFGAQLDLTPEAIDIAAPGSALHAALASTVSINTVQPSPPSVAFQNRSRVPHTHRFGQMLQGTSMASPVVTGLIACVLAEEPGLTQAEVLRRVWASGVMPAGAATLFDAGNPDKNDWGTGLIDARKLKPATP